MANRIFIYEGGRAPRHVRHARIDESLTALPEEAFMFCQLLLDVELHNGIEIVERGSFLQCGKLRWITLPGVRVIKNNAFDKCVNLEYVEFGDRLERVETHAFHRCRSLVCIVMPSVRRIFMEAFRECTSLTEATFCDELEEIESYAFACCPNLRRITIPLKHGMIQPDAFYRCPQLTTVDLVAIPKTVFYLHLESWKNDTKEEIDRINRVLPDTHSSMKTAAIQQWIGSVIQRNEQYKVEHRHLLKEATTLLELALWKANLDEDEEDTLKVNVNKGKGGSRKATRNEHRITSGASIVIKNVLSFLVLPQ
jgi:hypothetical protein